MLTEQHIKERLSLAFLHALSGRAGINFAPGTIHDYGIDAQLNSIIIARGKRMDSGFPVAIQLKATENWQSIDGNIIYDLDVHAYNAMVTRPHAAVPYYIFVLCLPKDKSLWMSSDESSLVLRNCCYWLREQGEYRSGSSTVRVRIPRTNMVTVDSLNQIMANARGELVP